MQNEIKIFCSEEWKDYELLDTGEGEKLERFGKYVFVRPYEDAVWPKTLKNEWEKIEGKFWSSRKGAKPGWQMSKAVFDKWEMEYRGIKFLAMPTPFRHFEFFRLHRSREPFCLAGWRRGDACGCFQADSKLGQRKSKSFWIDRLAYESNRRRCNKISRTRS